MAIAAPAIADPIRDAQWHLGFLNVAEAHKHSRGEGVIVGVLDTGVDGGHPDLAGSVLPGVDFTSQNGDGRKDLDGHGTSMAGLIAAHGRALGIAPRAKILPIRTKISFVAAGSEKAVDSAIDMGATVLCLAYSEEESSQVRRAVKRAIDNDVVVIAAVGNEPFDNLVYPVGYPGIVGAAGVDHAGNHAQISVISPFATLAAPAVDIATTDIRLPPKTGYQKGTGTSDATAIIAGAAALVRSKHPDLAATEVIHRLTATADDKGPPGRDNLYGFGVINLVKALTADVPPLRPSDTPAADTSAGPIAKPDGGINTRTLVVICALGLLALLCAGFVAAAFARRRSG